jgi:hypothetical protein
VQSQINNQRNSWHRWFVRNVIIMGIKKLDGERK